MRLFGKNFFQLPFRRARDIDELRKMLQGKSIALVGNAASFGGRSDWEGKYDIIIRMNRGYYELDAAGHKRIKKTDILLVSTKHDDSFLRDVPIVVRMSPRKRFRVPLGARRLLYLYPMSWWEELAREIGSAPSTGCMGIDLVTRLADPRQVSLLGFDFWKTPTSYTGENRPGPHDPQAEEIFARKRLPHAFAESGKAPSGL
jgi:hypothetical protein